MTALADAELIYPNMLVTDISDSGQSAPYQNPGPAADGQNQVVTVGVAGPMDGQTVNPVNVQSPQSVTNMIVTEGEKGNPQQEALLGGAVLTMIGSSTGSQMLSMILQTAGGNLIVIDGGFDADADRLRNEIKSRGGHVSAWLVTHPHKDHVGALNKLLQENANGITIDAIYCSLASPEWYSTYDPSGAEMAHTFISTLSRYPQNKIRYVGRGQTYQVDEVTIQVLNDRYELVHASDNHYTGNNASMIYMLTVNGKKLLILGDLCYEGGERLLADVGAPALKADIVQMAHHGQDGVSEQVYQAIHPSVCLWPTPTWLWNGDENTYATQTTRRWMNALGVGRHYVMKDGDQIIR